MRVEGEKQDCRITEGELRDALEAAGWRHTRQRSVVYTYLHSVDCHPTAEQVYRAVRQEIPNISLATVYKALEALVDAGLAAKLPESEGAVRYDGRSDPHYHLRDLTTGQVRDLPLHYDPELLSKLHTDLTNQLRSQGFEVTGHRLELVGHFRDKR